MAMRFAASIVVASLFLILAACGSSDDKLFDFPSPDSGSTCQQVLEYVREHIPPEGSLSDGMRFYAMFLPDLGGGVQPDFVVDVINPKSRDDFLNRKKSSEDRFQDWLAPSGLRLQDFLLIYYADKLKFDMGRDPETGGVLIENISGAEQIGGDVSCALGCSWKELVAPRTCPTP